MIRQIVRKEVLENLLSLRFALSMLMTTSLFVICGYVFVNGYGEQSKDYWKRTNENLSTLREQSSHLYEVAFYKQGIYRKPQPLGLCAEGDEKSLPNFFAANVFTVDLPKTKGQANFALPQFGNVDWVLIISLILSFVALVLTHDSICGEKEAGTLRLTLASAIPRHKVLLGKYFGAMITLAIPVVAGMLVSLMIVIPSKNVAIDTAAWSRILAIALVSLLYLSIFVLLGMLVSSRTGRSANSMAILLLVWVVSVILLPSFCRIIFDVSHKEPGEVELERQLRDVRDQIWDNREKYGKNAGSWAPDVNNPMNNPPARARLQNAITDAKNQVMEDHHNKLLAQAFARRNFACLSPAVIYQRASEAVAGTGINHCVDLYKQAGRYRVDLKEFIRGRDAEDPESLHLINPGRETVQGSWQAISRRPVDFDSVPKFQERSMALGQSLRVAIWDIGFLVLFNLGLFAAAFVSFLKYDVR